MKSAADKKEKISYGDVTLKRNVLPLVKKY